MGSRRRDELPAVLALLVLGFDGTEKHIKTANFDAVEPLIPLNL